MENAPVFVGHRGWPQEYPENSLAGFSAALERGAQALECDIQFSSDGVPVVLHDLSLARAAGIAGKVSDLPAAQLAQVSVHEPARLGTNAAAEPLPTLQQLVDLVRRYPAAVLFVEIKEEAFDYFPREYCAEQVMTAVAPMGTKAVVISFDSQVLQLARAAGATIGWVLKHYNTKARLEAAALAPEFLICNHRKLPKIPAPPWPGKWQWFLYDIVDWSLALAWAENGVRYIETWDIGAMLAQARSSKSDKVE